MKRVDSDINGLIVVRDVPVTRGGPDVRDSFVHITGIERGPGGFAVFVFLYTNEESPAKVEEFTRDHPGFLGELQIYATSSPVVPPHERISPPGLPEPRPLASYEAFIDLASNSDVVKGARDRVDLLLLLVTSDGAAVPSHRFQFTAMRVQSESEMT